MNHDNVLYCCIGSDDTCIHIYNVQDSFKLLRRLPTHHTDNIFYVKDMPLSCGQTLITCAADGKVIINDLIKNTSLELHKHKGRAHRLAIIPNSPFEFYSGGEDGVCALFDIRTNSLPDQGHSSQRNSAVIKTKFYKNEEINSPCPIYCIHVNPVKPYEIAVAGSTQHVAIFDARKFDAENPVSFYLCPNHLISSTEHITGIKYNFSGTSLLASYNDEDAYLFDINTHSKLSLKSYSNITSNDNVSDEVDCKSIDCSGMETGSIHNGYEVKFTGHRNNDTVKQISFFGSKSEYVISGSDDGNIFIWNSKSGEVVNMLHGDNVGAVNCLGEHPFLPLFASSGLDSNAKVWTPAGNF